MNLKHSTDRADVAQRGSREPQAGRQAGEGERKLEKQEKAKKKRFCFFVSVYVLLL